MSEARRTKNQNDTLLRQVSSDILEETLLPQWYQQLRPTWGEKIVVPEWEDDGCSYRAKNGWKGHDLIHDPSAAVYIPEYFVHYGSETDGLQRGGKGTTLTGLVYFSERAESHPGYCHGGSMCSVMDDVIGWVGFMVTGEAKPWTGFTVQINTSLQKPIPVYSRLMVVAEVKRLERRKVFIEARLVDPADNSQHAMADGIVVLNRGVLPPMLETQVSDVSMG
mmetsp:Transcript_2338/g.4658  ORF Transcript_2338/g.4658 Transcript_2338/m.4658 type:complete len:222 (-) Transcript_2338:53-718(-)